MFSTHDNLNGKVHFVERCINELSDFRTVVLGVKRPDRFGDRRNILQISVVKYLKPHLGEPAANRLWIVCPQEANRKRAGAPISADDDLLALAVKRGIPRPRQQKTSVAYLPLASSLRGSGNLFNRTRRCRQSLFL
ncbi:MAG TPA: hypothetical protein VFY05_11215 [Candidatus Angelobacter sp.]|nr:hypothetical protein [Candidatus Angelobacter sp.]